MSGEDNPRRSLLSLFGSPNKPKTGVAQVARSGSSSQVRPPRTLAQHFTASQQSLPSSQGQVSVDEFADTDSNHSGHSAEEARDAETIYSIISGYEDERNSNFLFMEDFSGHSHENADADKSGSKKDSPKSQSTPVGSPNTTTTASYNTPQGSVRGSRSYAPSTTSTELLGRIRSVEISGSSGSNSGSSGRGRYSASSRSSSHSRVFRSSVGPRSRDSRMSATNLTAGIDSASGLPVTLYTVQDAEHEQNRWSLFAKTAAPRSEVPQAPGQASSGSNSAIGSLESIKNHGTPSRAPPVHYAPFSGTSSDHPHHSIPTISTRVLGNDGSNHSGFSVTDHGEGVHFTPPLSPQESRLSDTEGRRSLHNDMFVNDSSEIVDQYDIEKGYPYFENEGITAQSWAKWSMLMIMGLVAIPVYFLLAFGYFDFGGYTKHMRRPPHGPVNRRYFACYTYWQKLWSFVIGVVWMLLVFAAIAIAFGLRARFHL